jgi:hypothetical protein
MSHQRLNARSETLMDDDGVTVEKRCIFLLAGISDQEVIANITEYDDEKTQADKKLDATIKSNGVIIRFSANIFDDLTPENPRKTADIKIRINNILIELCPDVVKSLTLLIPDFRALFRYKDLKKCSPGL